MLVREMLERYKEQVVPTFSERTQKDYAWIIKHLIAHFGEKDINELKPKDIGMFLDSPTGKQSRNRMVAVLSAAYSKAVGRWFVANNNPCLKVQRNESHPRTRYVTDEEFKAVHAIVPKAVQLAMELALLTYQRQGDLLKLTWDDVLENGIYFEQGKTGKRLLVKFTDAVEDVLLRCRRMAPEIPRKYVIRRRDGKRYSSEGFKAIWIRHMNEAVETGIIKERFTFHDLRAKAVSDSADIGQASLSAGHQNQGITRRVYDRNVREVNALR